MKLRKPQFHSRFILILMALMVVMAAACTPPDSDSGAQVLTQASQTNSDDEGSAQPATIEFTGQVDSVSGSIISVAGLSVDISGAQVSVTLAPGMTVHVQGDLQPNGTVIAVVIIVLPEATPEATSEATPEMTPEATPESTPEMTPEATPESTPEMTPEATTEPGSGSGVIIVVEGPVQAINVNVITIYNINIQLDPNDPALTVLQIGDVIRVEGEMDDHEHEDHPTIIIVAITIVFINVDVTIADGQVWRDSGNCSNPPPPWAPAHGWHRRCDAPPSNNGGSSGGSSGGHGHEDDD